MRKRLDPENLGIILLNAFMDEFFPEEKRSMPDTFDLLHYNGIPGSNYGNQVSDILWILIYRWKVIYYFELRELYCILYVYQ